MKLPMSSGESQVAFGGYWRVGHVAQQVWDEPVVSLHLFEDLSTLGVRRFK
jgi:hypothetical protein